MNLNKIVERSVIQNVDASVYTPMYKLVETYYPEVVLQSNSIWDCLAIFTQVPLYDFKLNDYAFK